MSAWTAFNALTTDLWITTVNAHPNLLDKLGKRQIRLRLLKEHRYSTNGHMGTIPRTEDATRIHLGVTRIPLCRRAPV